MTFLKGDTLRRVRDAIGKEPPPEHSVHGLSNVPAEIVSDLETIYREWGLLCAAAYLHHVTGANQMEVKVYLGNKGWHGEVD
jgi:hypothetical protein